VAGDGRRLVGALSFSYIRKLLRGHLQQTVVPETYGRVGDRVIVASGRPTQLAFRLLSDAGAPC